MLNNDAVNLAFNPKRGTERCRHCGAVSTYFAVPNLNTGETVVALTALDDRPGCPCDGSCPFLEADVLTRW